MQLRCSPSLICALRSSTHCIPNSGTRMRNSFRWLQAFLEVSTFTQTSTHIQVYLVSPKMSQFTPRRVTIQISYKRLQFARRLDRMNCPRWGLLQHPEGVPVICFPKGLPFSDLLHKGWSMPLRSLWRRGNVENLDARSMVWDKIVRVSTVGCW